MTTTASGRRFEAVCFDLDETLIDSAVAWRAGFLDAFALEVAPRYPELGATAEPLLELQPLLVAEVQARGGRWGDFVIRDAVRKFFRAHGIEDDRSADRTTEAYEAAWPRHITLFPDALSALDAAAELGPLALITNGPSTGQRLKLERTGLLDRFEVLAISEEVGAEKPDLEIFTHTLEGLGIHAAAAVHIGDNLHMDIRGARDAGMTAVWLNRRGGDPAEGVTPHHEVADLEAFVQLLG
ncbi:MAG: HAD family hydrolase [Dehalococcoidia bacterium]|nr:HAD family hydrolase [Dehalococcoidia bacterium]